MNEFFDAMIILDANLEVWKLLIRLVLAIFAGILFGLESRARSKDAGLKTQTLLCLIACLLMIISKYGFYEIAKLSGVAYDAARVASTTISGLSLIAVGMVIYKKDSVKGLTTAASLCLTIAVGMCFGAGLIITGLSVTIITLLLQLLLHSTKGPLRNNRHLVVHAKFYIDNNYIIRFKELFGIKHFLNFIITREDDKKIAEVEFFYKIKVSSEELVEMIQREEQIIMIEKY